MVQKKQNTEKKFNDFLISSCVTNKWINQFTPPFPTSAHSLLRGHYLPRSSSGDLSRSPLPPALPPHLPSYLGPTHSTSRVSTSSSHQRSSSGFSENHRDDLNNNNNNNHDKSDDDDDDDEDDMERVLQKPFSLNSLGGISCLSLEPNLKHDATFDDSD